MGFVEWIGGFSLPKTEDECNALRTAETDAKPVQWDSTASKCKFFVPTDEARLGMANCTATQMFDMSNNTCSAKVPTCDDGMYYDGTDCVDAPSSVFDQATLVAMGACGAKVTENGTHSWTDGACSLSCNDSFSLNDAGDTCAAVTEETDGSSEEFTNVRKLSDREQKHLFILLALVVLMYVYRKQLKQALRKAKICK